MYAFGFLGRASGLKLASKPLESMHSHAEFVVVLVPLVVLLPFSLGSLPVLLLSAVCLLYSAVCPIPNLQPSPQPKSGQWAQKRLISTRGQ